MKVALAHYSRPEDISGVTTWFEELVVRLHNDGVNLCVLLNHFGGEPESASILPRFLDAGVTVEIVKRGRSLEKDVLQTLKFLNNYKPTVFLPQCLPLHYFAASIAGKQGLPWALTIHSDDPDYWQIASERPPVKYGGKTVSVSEHIANLVLERGVDNHSITIPYGVKVLNQKAVYNYKPFRVLYSGRLVETQKRMSLVTSTFINACNNDPNVCARIIGDGPARADCESAVENAGLSNRIIFVGRLTSEEVKIELLKAQAILFMSDFEGLPVALLEAMAVGVVPVVRNIPSGIPELVHHERTGLLVDEQPEKAAEALIRLTNDPSLWESCSVAARQLVSGRYGEDVCYERWLSFIEELAGQSKAQYPLRVPVDLGLPTSDLRFHYGYPNLFRFYPRVRLFSIKTASTFYRLSRAIRSFNHKV